MTNLDTINYADILGAVTGGPRLNLDVIQGAMAIRPEKIPAGRFFEIIFLLQNASDIEVDVVVKVELPERDAQGKKGNFLLKTPRLRVGLNPAEAGFVTLPVATSPHITPAAGYVAVLHLQAERVGKNPQRVRAAAGGGPFILSDLPEETQAHLQALRMLRFSVDTGGKKNMLRAPFDLLPPAVTSLKELQPAWVSLWTMRDHADEYIIAQKVWPQVQAVLPKLRREQVFMPLLKATQDRFRACQYPLHPPEAIYITKILTLILEMGITEPSAADPRPPWPHWFVRLCRVLLQEPALAGQVEPLVARLLYNDLVYDAVTYGFTMVSTVVNEEFGSEEEREQFADSIVEALAGQKPLDFSRVYFPLILAGLIANMRVIMPREQVQDTVLMLSKALNNRRNEQNADNRFVFDMAEKLIERALDMTG